jgi:hypothetical protein
MKDKVKFKKCMAMMGEVYNKDITSVLSDVYWSALQCVSDVDADRVFKRAVTELKWFPKPAELLEMSGNRGTIEDQATVQAYLVLDTIRAVGAYMSVKFADPVTNAVIARMYGNWPKACELLEKDTKWFVKDFVTTYRAFATTGQRSNSHLAGLAETYNNASGNIDHVPAVMQIGALERKQIGQQSEF